MNNIVTEDQKVLLGELWGDDLLAKALDLAMKMSGEPVRYGLLMACAISILGKPSAVKP